MITSSALSGEPFSVGDQSTDGSAATSENLNKMSLQQPTSETQQKLDSKTEMKTLQDTAKVQQNEEDALTLKWRGVRTSFTFRKILRNTCQCGKNCDGLTVCF